MQIENESLAEKSFWGLDDNMLWNMKQDFGGRTRKNVRMNTGTVKDALEWDELVCPTGVKIL